MWDLVALELFRWSRGHALLDYLDNEEDLWHRLWRRPWAGWYNFGAIVCCMFVKRYKPTKKENNFEFNKDVMERWCS